MSGRCWLLFLLAKESAPMRCAINSKPSLCIRFVSLRNKLPRTMPQVSPSWTATDAKISNAAGHTMTFSKFPRCPHPTEAGQERLRVGHVQTPGSQSLASERRVRSTSGLASRSTSDSGCGARGAACTGCITTTANPRRADALLTAQQPASHDDGFPRSLLVPTSAEMSKRDSVWTPADAHGEISAVCPSCQSASKTLLQFHQHIDDDDEWNSCAFFFFAVDWMV